MKLVKLVIQVFIIAYYSGLFWYFIVDYNNRFFHKDEGSTNFLVFHGFTNKDSWTLAIESTYYAATTLSTVGFGDMYPVNDIERIMCSIMMFSGVAAFTFFMSQLFTMLEQIRSIVQNTDFQDEENDLVNFVMQLRRFNHGNSLPKGIEQ